MTSAGAASTKPRGSIGKAYRKMQRARWLALITRQIVAVLQTHRPDRQIQAKTKPRCQLDIGRSPALAVSCKPTGIDKCHSFESPPNVSHELNIGIPPGLTTGRISIDQWTQLTVWKTAHTAATTIEHAQVDRQILTVTKRKNPAKRSARRETATGDKTSRRVNQAFLGIRFTSIMVFIHPAGQASMKRWMAKVFMPGRRRKDSVMRRVIQSWWRWLASIHSSQVRGVGYQR